MSGNKAMQTSFVYVYNKARSFMKVYGAVTIRRGVDEWYFQVTKAGLPTLYQGVTVINGQNR